MKTWINSKVKKEKHGVATSYNFTKFECEICKSPFPQKVIYDQKEEEMMEIKKPTKPYIMLETLYSKP